MKKLPLLLFVTVLVISCSRNKAEQMLYDYQQKNVQALNFDLKDLEFKIHNIEKFADILAADSMEYLKIEFAQYWQSDAEQSLIDTLSFEYVKAVLNKSIAHQDTLRKLYQEAVLAAIEYGDYSYEIESQRKRDQSIKDKISREEVLFSIEKIENRYNEYSQYPQNILSSKYRATYSLKNPMMGNVKQTFNKFFYTNFDQTEFVKEESIDSEK